MMFLDILPIDPAERARRIKEFKLLVKDSIDAIRDSADAAKDAVADSTAQAQLIIDNAVTGQSDASLLLPMAVVAAALAGCLSLAHLYKRRLQTGRSGNS